MVLSMSAYFFFNNINMKNKTFSIFRISLLALLLFSVVSCKDKKPAQGPQPTEFEKGLTNEDSTKVAESVTGFFENVKNGNLDDAVAMLYKANNDTLSEEPQPLGNADMKRVKAMLNSFPIVRYNIDFIKFSERTDNEVKVTAVIAEAHDNVPEIKTVFYFKPVKFMDGWKLCLIDSHNSDYPVVANDKRDSVQNRYAKEMREKEEKK